MTLQPQPIALAFTGGIETKEDPKTVPATQLIDLQNATFIKKSTLAKRNGYRARGRTVDTVGTYGTPRGLAERDGEMLLFDDRKCWSYRDSSDTWALAGSVSVAAATDQPIARTGTQQSQPDVATRHGITVAAWEDSRGGVHCSILEDSTGRILLEQHLLDAAGAMPRCLQVGEGLQVLWINAARIFSVVINPATPTTPLAPIAITEDLDPSAPYYDAESTLSGYSIDRPAVIAWTTPGGYRVGYLAASGSLGSPASGLPSVATFADATMGPLSVTFNPAGIVVGWFSGTALKMSVKTPSSPAVATMDATAVPVIGAGGLRVTGTVVAGAWYYAAEIASAGLRTDQQAVSSGNVVLATGAVTAPTTLKGHTILSRSFADASDAYVSVAHAARFYPYVAVVRLTAAFGGANTTVVARLLPGLSAGMLLRSHLPSVQALDIADSATAGRVHGIPLCYRIQLASSNGDQFGEQGIRYVSLDLGSAPYATAPLGRGLYLAGALPLHYDGSRWAEADFHAAPDYGYTFTIGSSPPIATLTPLNTITQLALAAGGTMTSGAKYLYAICYEEIDGQGELHPGAVGVKLTATLGGGDTRVTLTIPTYRCTAKNRVRIGVFRTAPNATGAPDSIEYFRVSSTDPTAAGSNGYVLNDPTVDTVTFVDDMADATVATREPLYTNGGILSNDPPDMAGGALDGGKSRLYWTASDDPNLVYYSQQLRDDTAVEMSAALSVRIDPYGGAVVAVSAMDDVVYVFKATSIYGFGGPGPDADGGKTSSNAWSPPQLLTSDVGCTDPGSICQAPMGLVFKSAKGFKMLGRDQQVADIGAPVYGFNDQRVTRATLLPDRHQIVFLTDSGFTLLWDYERNQWSKYTNHEGIDALVHNGSYCYLRNDGRVFVETPGAYRDDNSHIPMLIETAWIKAAGYLQGWQKILFALFLGKFISAHILRVRFRLDYEDAYSAPIDLDVNANYNPALYGAGLYGAGVYGGSGTTVYQKQIHMNKRCQSISFRIEDVEATDDYGASFELSELLLIGGVLGAKHRVGAARQA